MKPPCPICHAEYCPEERPDCRARGEARRALWERANGFEPPPKPLCAVSPAETEVRRLCAALWPGQSVTTDRWRRPVPAARRGRRETAPSTWVIRVGAAVRVEGREIARGDSEAAAWEAALAEMRQVLPARLAQIDRETAAMAAERARLTAALEVTT